MRAGGTVNTGNIDWTALPALYAPFPSATDEHAGSVHRSTTEWLGRCLVLADDAAYRRFFEIKIGRLAARFHPDAPLDAPQLISDWYDWTFFWDDQRDETEIGEQPSLLAERNAGFLEIMTGSGDQENDPLAHALLDLRERVIAGATTETWMRRLVNRAHESGCYRSSVGAGPPVGGPR